MKKLLLIDGNAILHRAYHALPPLTNKKGEIVNAVYGFFSMLLTVVADLKPTCLIVCFDRPKPTFRQSLYAGYQQHRPKMADDLVSQIGILHEMLAEIKVVVFEVDGYEADDLIGTIVFQVVESVSSGRFPRPTASFSSFSPGARRGSPTPASKHAKNSANFSESDKAATLEVVILSGDRDMLQLVNSHVKVLAPVVGVKNTVLYDSEKVKEKYGITPAQMVDFKALVGDASDGYPGVVGVGPKTARQLLNSYETLEGIYEHIGELNPKLSEKLAQGSEQAALCKKLATIVTDAPITFKIEDCDMNKLDVESWTEVFAEQGFKSLMKRVETVFPKEEEKKKVDEQLGLL